MPGRALHIALHAAQHGVDSERPLTDLGRAIRVVDEQVWREATELARRVDALPAFATGLRLDDPAGRRLVEHLHLPVDRPPLVVLRAGPEVRVAITLERLASEGSLRARARLLLGALLPSPGYMRKWAPAVDGPGSGRDHRVVSVCRSPNLAADLDSRAAAQGSRHLASSAPRSGLASEGAIQPPLALLAQPGRVQEHCAGPVRVRLQPLPPERRGIHELAIDAAPAPASRRTRGCAAPRRPRRSGPSSAGRAPRPAARPAKIARMAAVRSPKPKRPPALARAARKLGSSSGWRRSTPASAASSERLHRAAHSARRRMNQSTHRRQERGCSACAAAANSAAMRAASGRSHGRSRNRSRRPSHRRRTPAGAAAYASLRASRSVGTPPPGEQVGVIPPAPGREDLVAAEPGEQRAPRAPPRAAGAGGTCSADRGRRGAEARRRREWSQAVHLDRRPPLDHLPLTQAEVANDSLLPCRFLRRSAHSRPAG